MMYLLLQVAGIPSTVVWIIAIVVLVIAGTLYFRKILRDQRKREAINHDPRSHAINDSNYNIAREGIDGHRTENMSATEADHVVEGFRETGEIPSREEFEALRDNQDKPGR